MPGASGCFGPCGRFWGGDATRAVAGWLGAVGSVGCHAPAMRPSVAAVIALGRLPAESVDDLEVWLRFEQALGALPERCLDEEALVLAALSVKRPDSGERRAERRVGGRVVCGLRDQCSAWSSTRMDSMNANKSGCLVS